MNKEIPEIIGLNVKESLIEELKKPKYNNDITARLIGVNIEDAKSLIKENGFKYRITCEDGVPNICTCDYRTDRINIEINDNIITKADVG